MVMDTNVIVSGLRNPSGASAELIDQALAGRFTSILSVAPALEYEAICCDPTSASVRPTRIGSSNSHLGTLRGRRACSEPVSVATQAPGPFG